MSVILLECENAWAARDTIMCDLFRMFESEEMLGNWQEFFTNAGHDADEPTTPKWQMCDHSCDFLTTGDQEQLYHVYHSGKSLIPPRNYFQNFCISYDHSKENN